MSRDRWLRYFFLTCGLTTWVACAQLTACDSQPGQPDSGNTPEVTAETTTERANEASPETAPPETTPEPSNETPAPDAGDEPPPEQAQPEQDPPSESLPEGSGGIVFYGQVQPIIQENCQVCHGKQNAIAPFPLTTYEEVKAKGSLVKWSVENRRMPPWMPLTSPDCPDLDHSLALSDDQIKTITRWVDGGMLEGDPANARTFQPKQDQLANIDVEVGAQAAHTPSGNSQDDYHCFLTEQALPTTASAKDLIGFQLLPGVREMVHHVLIYRVNAGYAQDLEQQRGKDWKCYTGALFNQSGLTRGGLLGVWVPGTDVVHFPQGTGMPMQPGDHLVLEIHYNLATLSAPQADQTKIRLEFARAPVQSQLQLTLQADFGLNVPPKSTGTATNTFSSPATVKVWGFMPHMHKYGTKFKTVLRRGGAAPACFVDIPRWDYSWQQTFFFKQPLTLNAGDKLDMTCTFDNPTDKPLRWGDRTEDEMCLNFYFYSTR